MASLADRDDFSRVERALKELDLERRLSSLRDRLGEDWPFVVEYATREVRATLELGLMIRSLLDVAETRGHVSPDVSGWMRANQTFRSRNFGVADESDARFMELALSERGVGLLAILEGARQSAEARCFDEGLPIVNPPPLGKRQLLDIPLP